MAEVKSNTLVPIIETWDDPGDYPSNAGAGPLPSYDYCAGMEGEIVLALTEEEFLELGEFSDKDLESREFQEYLNELVDGCVPDNFYVDEWDFFLKGDHLTLFPSENAEITER